MDMSEEDQMLRAIAMSLGENVTMSTDQVSRPKQFPEDLGRSSVQSQEWQCFPNQFRCSWFAHYSVMTFVSNFCYLIVLVFPETLTMLMVTIFSLIKCYLN